MADNKPTPAVARTIFQIGDDVQALNDLLNSIGGDLSDPEVDKAVMAWLEENKSNLNNKIESYVALIEEHSARGICLNGKIAAIKSLRDSHNSRANKLLANLKYFMESNGITHLQTETHDLKLVGNGGTVPLNITAQPEDLPDEFVTLERKPNTDAIRKALESGQELPFASLGERGNHVQIR